jgi:anti-sigma regulatory factor (Ser/Thr protein kinase)
LHATSNGRGRAELVATELATNLVQHAKPGGWILVRPLPLHSIEFIAVDHGPGIGDLGTALAGRAPAPQGLGCGMAAVQRASSYFDAHTGRGQGTIVLSIVDLARLGGAGPGRRAWAGVSVGVTDVCGDGWAVTELDRGLAVTVVDGLGHGAAASAAAEAAVQAFAADPGGLTGFVDRANTAMRTTRGAAAAVCRLDTASGQLEYLAIGNINGRVLFGSENRGLAGNSGTLGIAASPPKARVMRALWPPGATLIMWTDGLTSRFEPPADAELLNHDPAVIAASLHRDRSRERDDATIVVIHNPERL